MKSRVEGKAICASLHRVSFSKTVDLNQLIAISEYGCTKTAVKCHLYCEI